MRIWAQILLGCVNHRKPTNSSNYVNVDQQYVLYYIATKKKVNPLALVFQHVRDVVKETRNGSRKMRNWIPLGRLISDILMESKLIYSLTNAEKTKGLESLVMNFFNDKSLKNMGIVTDLTSPTVEIPKEVLYNIRIPLEDFHIFSNPEPMDCGVSYRNSNYTSDVPTTS